MNGYLREVTIEDMDLLFEWANEESVRRNSFSTKKITYEEHVAWFKRILSEENTVQYIYMVNDVPIGQVRINIFDDKAEIGYSVCNIERGKGHGRKILKLLHAKVKEEYPFIKKLIGKVKPENIASQKAFLAVGYGEAYKAFEINMD